MGEEIFAHFFLDKTVSHRLRFKLWIIVPYLKLKTRIMDTVKKAFFILEQILAQQHTDLSFSDIVRTQRSPKSNTHLPSGFS